MSMTTCEMKRGDLFNHYRLGECQVHKIHADGSLTVITANIIDGANVFELRRPDHPGWWRVSAQGRGRNNR